MPKNTKGGKKAKSLKNSTVPTKNRELPVPLTEDDSHIALITKVQGDSRYLCQIVDENGLQSHVYPVNLSKGTKNKYGKGIIINTDTYVLISIREFQKDKGDIIFIYKDNEISTLVSMGLMRIINKDTNKTDKFSVYVTPDSSGILMQIPTQSWNHLVISYDKSVVDIFVNGNLEKSVPLSSGKIPEYNTGDVIEVGEGDNTVINGGLHGAICNVVYHKAPLTASQIAIDYNLNRYNNPPVNN
jgi:hypothetical protein